jgi:hypothetical protein
MGRYGTSAATPSSRNREPLKAETFLTIENVSQDMNVELNAGTVEWPEEQGELVLCTYTLESTKDPNSHAAAAARSNLIALLHTITQIYAESAALEVKTALSFACAGV